jgi:hypothetical protein
MLKDGSLKLAQREIDATLATNIRYGRQDLAIVDWDGAFLMDASGESKKSIAVLEMANIHLLNFRILDRMLTEKINLLKLHRDSADFGSFFRISPFMKNVIQIRRQSVLETYRVHPQALWRLVFWQYLYELASKKFHLNTWRAQVNANFLGQRAFSSLPPASLCNRL